MLDAGIGHGAGDFEGIQLRTIAKGQALDGLWSATDDVDDANASKRLLDRPAYQELEQHVGQCGTVGFAEASVAVPFVRSGCRRYHCRSGNPARVLGIDAAASANGNGRTGNGKSWRIRAGTG